MCVCFTVFVGSNMLEVQRAVLRVQLGIGLDRRQVGARGPVTHYMLTGPHEDSNTCLCVLNQLFVDRFVCFSADQKSLLFI